MESSTASPETDEIVHAEQGEDAVSEDVDKMVQSGSHAHELEKEEDQDVANEVRLLPTLSSSLHLKDIRIHTQDARHGRQRQDGPGHPLRRSDHVTFLQGESSATVNGDTRRSVLQCNSNWQSIDEVPSVIKAFSNAPGSIAWSSSPKRAGKLWLGSTAGRSCADRHSGPLIVKLFLRCRARTVTRLGQRDILPSRHH